MDREKLVEIIEVLKSELNGTHEAADKDRIQKVIFDVQQLIDYFEDADHDRKNLKDRLRQYVDHFERTHPKLASQIGHVVEMLSQMGI